jgi:glycosyltransferase involved in cell wall biosynthesis
LPSIVLTVSAAPHQRDLAEALARSHVLRRAIRFGPDLEILEPEHDGSLKTLQRVRSYRFGTRVLWGLWRRLPFVGDRDPAPVLAWSWIADHWIARAIPPCDIFHGLTGVCLASLRAAAAQGAVTIVDIATLHPDSWQREVLADFAAAGGRSFQSGRLLPAVLMRRQEREFRECDRIVVYSSAARRSFQQLPYEDKVVVVQPGVDHRLFRPAAATPGDRTFRVCYVGRIEAAKGVQYLLGAWNRLALPDSELVLAGRILPEMEYLQKRSPPANVRLAGILSRDDVAELYRRSHLFIFPSVNEGLPLVVLEAMSSGLPVIACAGTGVEDCIRAGTEGLLVKGRDPDAIAGALQWCYEHRADMVAMGAAARARIEQDFTLSHYHERLLALYRTLAPR